MCHKHPCLDLVGFQKDAHHADEAVLSASQATTKHPAGHFSTAAVLNNQRDVDHVVLHVQPEDHVAEIPAHQHSACPANCV